jgi:hypothetical protein
MKVSILGVFVGGIVDVSTSFILGLPLAVYVAFKVPLELRMGPHANAAVSSTIRGNHLLYFSELAIGLLCSAFGGYVAAAIAKRHERLNGALSSYLCVGLGIITLAFHLQHDPLWQQLLLLAASPVVAFIGGDLRSRQRLRRPNAIASV